MKTLVEKYRPNSINEVFLEEKNQTCINHFIEKKNFPNLLFYGPSGTGKTSTIIAMAREIYKEKYNLMVLELNASDNRNIQVVRKIIKEFASCRTLFNSGYKLIILDEVDSMTNDAQFCLRRIMETYCNNVRFCFICNYLKKINPAIQSRCVIFRFNPISYDMMYKFSINICENENIKIKKRALELVIKKSNGDLRKLLNYLQSLYMHNHHLISDKKVNLKEKEDVYILIDEKSVSRILACPTEKAIEDLLKYIKNNKLNESIKYLTELIETKDISLLELINYIYEYCMENLINNTNTINYSKEKIVNIIKDLAIINENLTYCNNENIQLISLLSIFYKI